MEPFLLQNAARHQQLVKQFKPKARTANDEHSASSSSIKVATRIRPILADEAASGQVPAAFLRPGESGVVDLHELRRVVRGPPPLNSFSFRAGKVFGANCATEEIYHDLVQPLLPWAWDGRVGTLFAYGQTGSGKTFTISGLERLVAGSLFDGTVPGDRKLHISIFELAGNSSYDLLNSRTPFQILEDSFGNTQLAGATEKHVTSSPELLALIDQAISFRQTASTEKNDGSSRTHAICRIRIENPAQYPLDDGFLYLVDLAGSEAARDIAQHTADRMKETREINMSLSTLKDCIRGMASIDNATGNGKASKKPYIPYRQSLLTRVLKHVFDPAGQHECRTAVLACINPSLLDTGASKNTLRYAEMLRSAEAKTKPSGYHSEVPTTWSNKELRNYIKIKSGTPSILPSFLAPNENGQQLLRLPEDQFVQRCLQSDGVTEQQARAFYAKFWQLHIDSQRKSSSKGTGANGKDSTLCRDVSSTVYSTSRDPNSREDGDMPHFKERIRPGMVVRWTAPRYAPVASSPSNLALVLCPQGAAGEHARDVSGSKVNQGSPPSPGRYLCALVIPGALAETYEVHVWRQIVLDREEMEAEVLLEYDTATRYYRVAV